MSQPTPYNRLYNFTDFQTVNPTAPLPATQLDNELNAVQLTAAQIRTNLGLIQRDDGALANQSVTPDSLSAGALAMISQGEYAPKGAWAEAVTYALGDVVTYNAATYLCIVAHTSVTQFVEDLNNGRWLLIANGALSGQASAINLYEGDGTETVFTLSFNYVNSNAATVFVSGVAQIPVQDFTISGTTITFVTAPPAPSVAGKKNVMVRGAGVEAQLASDAAETFAANAANSATASANSATASATSASAASGSATTATTQATNAATSATAASTSATNAANSAATATTQAAASSSSATAAATSATNASTSEANAQAYELSANQWATQLVTPVAGGEYSAKFHAQAAATSATSSASSATAAATSATNAAASASTIDRYIGPLATNPTVRVDGSALQAGDLYFNTVAVEMRVYSGTAWQPQAASPDTLTERNFVATAGQTSYTFAGGYRIGYTYVYVNGLLLDATDIVATDGTTITFNTALAAGDEVRILSFKAVGSVTAVDVGALPTTGGTMTGDIVFAGTQTFPGTGDVTLTGTQTLTNKDLTSSTNTFPSSLATLTGTETLTNKTLTDPAIIGTILEDVFTITDGAAFEIDPGNGSIQLIELGANRTPKATNFAAGEAITLMVDDGTAYTLTWSDSTFGTTGVEWKTDAGVAPTLNTTGYTVIVLWKVASQVYGARVGNN
jgi:hypothetical protein